MSINLNVVIVGGRLTRDPEAKALPSGTTVTAFSLATNRTYKDKDDAVQEEVQFHDVVAFGRQGETTAKYLKKGDSALVQGRLQTRSWENDGVKHFRTEIIADHVQFGEKSGGSTPVETTSEVGGEEPPF